MSGLRRSSPAIVRWFKFNLVGAVGIVIQLGVLAVLKSTLNLDYLLATALAVEAAVLHNFIWHETFTWPDRKTKSCTERLIKFNATNGAISICGNVLAMKLLVGIAGLTYLTANLLSIAACSLLNFVIADRAVFISSSSNRFCQKWE
jgi:putative flippase GtrA